MKSLNNVTEVVLLPTEWRINIKSNIVTIGSCFAEVLGNQLVENKFSTLSNPLGTVFNPLSMAKLINLAIDNQPLNPALFIENQDGIWLHHDFHSSIWDKTQQGLIAKAENILEQLRLFLKNTDLLVMTFGSAFAYRHKVTNQLIGNCHKIPANNFNKELLHNDQIQIVFEEMIFKLLSFNRHMKIMISVSPVRHTRDTLPLNQVSKSTLRILCHRLSEKFRHVVYFPAYEIMLDELRDYRYFKEDLIHPNKIAEDHIFRIFTNHYLEKETLLLIEQWGSIKQMINHRPSFGLTPSFEKHLKSIDERLVGISHLVNVEEERSWVATKLSEYLA